jgi:probable phosphoglycerate mutase
LFLLLPQQRGTLFLEGGEVTATILLVRHAAHSHLGQILSGRSPDIALSDTGRSQAQTLAGRLSGTRLHAVHSSPVQRAQETAALIAAERRALPVEVVPALNELDFGDWSGRAFVELNGDPRWATWNESRSTAVAPNGESMAEAQLRAWAHIEEVALTSANQTIVMVSHCDIIRAVVAHVLGVSLNLYGRFDIDPASVTRLAVGEWGAKVLSLNETCYE